MLLVKNLETPRLTIRSWQKTDKEFTLSLWGDRENGKYMGDPVRENMDEAYHHVEYDISKYNWDVIADQVCKVYQSL